ncbi:MAG: ATP-binding protein [Cellulosilyticaceae bacterium]
MRTSIHWKIVGIYLCVVLIIMVSSGSFIIYNIESSQYEKLRGDMIEAADAMETILLAQDGFGSEDLTTMDSTLRNIMGLNKYEIHILDERGFKIIGTSSKWDGSIVDSDVIGVVRAEHRPYTQEYHHFGNSQITDDLTKKGIEHAKPIFDPVTSEMKYIIYVVADSDEIYSNILEVMKTISLGSVLAMIMAALFSGVFSRMITVPIKQLTSSSKQLASGSFNRIPIYSYDEIGQLTQSFNYMATELSRTMGDISSEKSKLEKILENMADGVMAFNRQGVLIHANSVCYEMLGNTNMDHRFDYIYPKLGVEVSFDQLMAGEVIYEDGIMMNVEDKFFNLHFAPYTNVLGESEGLVVVMQDITNQHKLDQMRKEFVANVSHELRTPLTTVKSYTETLLDGAIEDKEIAVQFLQVMEKEADRMTTLVQDLLELSRIDNKQMQLEMRPINLGTLVLDTVEAQEIHAQKKGHKLRIEMDEHKDYTILGDGARIRQILHNIVSNAIKYSIDPGQITVKLFVDDYVVVQVQDTGIGISKPDLERIFERFYRVDKARSRNMGGTGLGLSIAKEMVELHGGKITVTSKVGKGTTVTVYFNRHHE